MRMKKTEESFLEDDKIVDLFLSRDEQAITETSKKYGKRLRRIAFDILCDHEAAEECENDAYLKTWNLIPPHEPRTYLFAFVGRIVRHCALDICKANRRQKRNAVYSELTQEMQECIPAPYSTEAEMDRLCLKELLETFLDSCSEEQQRVFVRRYWYFESVESIAKRYGMTQSKVKTVLFRMRKKLKENLKNGGYSL